jgi:hypothetical protein
MPYDDPAPDDPQELVGVELPGDEAVTRGMAEAFADEFAQLGLARRAILALFRQPHYAGAHRAWRLLGEEEIARIVDASLSVYGRFTWTVTDAPDEDEAQPAPLRLYRRS